MSTGAGMFSSHIVQVIDFTDEDALDKRARASVEEDLGIKLCRL